MTEKITSALVNSLTAPAQGNAITYDKGLRGFGVRVTATGVRAFIFNYTVAGQERRYTIGRLPEWTVLRARERAKELRRLIDQGGDPLQKRRDDRDAPTIKDLWEKYRDEHLPTLSPRAQKDVRSMWEKLILPELATIKVARLTSDDSDRLHRSISQRTPIRANRALEVLRKALNLAERWRWIDRNPVDGFQRNPEHRRERPLTIEEATQFATALTKLENQRAADALRLLILTGARLREVLNAEWSQFDLASARWKKPAATTKQRRDHVTPLSDAAVAILTSLDRSNSKYVFPNTKGDAPIADLKRPWRQIQKLAGLQGVRLHDLRHSFASFLGSMGLPLPFIGTLLGHTQHQTTMRYTHLADAPLRKATNQLASLLAFTGRPADG